MPELTINIPVDKVDEFKLGFFEVHPVPKDEDGTPLYTELEWAKMVVLEYIRREYREGKSRIANKATTVDNDIVS